MRGVGVLYNAPAAWPPARSPATPCPASYVGPGVGLEKKKYLAAQGFGPRIVQRVGSHYTDWAIATANR